MSLYRHVSVKIAVALVQQRVLTEREALLHINPAKLSYFLHGMIDPVTLVSAYTTY